MLFRYFILEINQVGKANQLREQAEKINTSLFIDLLDYSDQELKKNPKDTFLLIAQSYGLSQFKEKIYLNEEKQYEQAIKVSDQALNDNPQHLYEFIVKKKHAQAKEILEEALKLNPNYVIAQYQKGYTLNSLQKYNDAIICQVKAIQLDPNFAIAYSVKAIQFTTLYVRCKNTMIQFIVLTRQQNQILIMFQLISIKNELSYKLAIITQEIQMNLDTQDNIHLKVLFIGKFRFETNS